LPSIESTEDIFLERSTSTTAGATSLLDAMAERAVAERLVIDLTDSDDDPQALRERVLVLRAQVGDRAAFHELVTRRRAIRRSVPRDRRPCRA